MVQPGELAAWDSAYLLGDRWRLSWAQDRLILTTPKGAHTFAGVDASRLSVSRRWFCYSLLVQGLEPGRFRGVRRQDVPAIRSAVKSVVARAELAPMLSRLTDCRARLTDQVRRHLIEGRWIPSDSVWHLLPTWEDLQHFKQASASGLLTMDEHEALASLGTDPWHSVREANETIAREELARHRAFFDHVEKTPLTAEQALAVVTYDNRVRVIAAAGSGKTSVMVARAAYAIARGFAAPERVLMLAFNADAAAELQTRVTARLAALGLPSEGLQATTFHSFGRSLIGRATGRKPSIAAWVENGAETEKVSAIIDDLRATSDNFRLKWDVFRLLHGRVSGTPDGGEPDCYDRASRRAGFSTFHGETVRSEGERLIADWLYLNGVEYRYEQPYPHDVADSSHAQYRPDFYYPQLDVWHEHWALRADGTPPDSFVSYADDMAWKRNTHRQYGTTLLETTWHEIIDFSGFGALAEQLRDHGQRLDWNPERPTPGAQPIEPQRLARLFRTFMAHVKANGRTRADLHQRLAGAPSPRSRLFLELYWQIHDRWERDLRAAQAIDFDDMLLQAAGRLDHDPALASYDLILVDEFQDTSQSRARLVRALTRGAGKHLLVVGDDWQAINRFAGADTSTLAQFEQEFGPAQTLYLQTTFRNPQRIADVASRFISRNPTQLPKRVISHHRDPGQPIVVVRVADQSALHRAVRDHLTHLGAQSPGGSVDILGRYRRDREFVPRGNFGGLTVTFRTIHAAKGLEADHIVLPNLTTGTYSFPSRINDDPVLALAMAAGDDFPDAEERRLFYVALSRARQSVALFTIAGAESPFVVELLNDPDVIVYDASPNITPTQACPACGQGTLVPRTSQHGEFLGCSRFPACTYKTKADAGPGTQGGTRP